MKLKTLYIMFIALGVSLYGCGGSAATLAPTESLTHLESPLRGEFVFLPQLLTSPTNFVGAIFGGYGNGEMCVVYTTDGIDKSAHVLSPCNDDTIQFRFESRIN